MLNIEDLCNKAKKQGISADALIGAAEALFSGERMFEQERQACEILPDDELDQIVEHEEEIREILG